MKKSTNFLTSFRILLGMLLLAIAIPSKAQVSAYSFTSTSGTYYQVGLGADLTATSGFYDDNNFTTVTLPFTFTYAGTAFTNIGISANGYTKLGGTTTTVYSGQLASITNCIAPFAADLYGNTAVGGDISWDVNGTFPNRVFTIQWTNWGFFSSALNEASFQIKLYETSNTVQFVYGNCPGTSSRTVQVGLTGAATTDFNDRTTTTDWSATTPGGANTATCTFSTGVVPISGQTFTWTSAATVAGMAFTSSSGLYIPIQAASASTVLTTTSGNYDDNNFPIATIPFSFTYSGTPYTTIGISANGYTKMGSVTTTVYSQQLLNITNCIAAFASDLYGNCTATNIPGEVSYNVIGTSPNRQFVIQWTRWGFYSTALNEATFQIRLYETSNVVQVVYGNSPGATSRTVQVGLSGSVTTDFNDRTTTTNWTATTAGGSNTATCSFGGGVNPLSGQTYTWTPSSTTPTVTNMTPNPACPGAVVVITGTNFTGATAVQVNGINVASFVVNSSTQITATLTATQTTGLVSVTTASGSGSSAGNLTVSPGVNVSVVTATPPNICPGGNSTLLASASPTGVVYCSGTYSTGTGFGDYITNVTLGTINNTTGASATPYLTYYSATNTNLTAGNNYNVTGTLNNGGTEDVAVWIDYNQDGNFDPTEKLGEQQSLAFNIGFTVPASAYNGQTRMRVRNVYFTTGILPCNAVTYGEIEDYNVTIFGATANPTAASSYAWSPATYLSSTTTNPTNATAVASTTSYTVTATTSSGCTGTGTVSIVVGAPLTTTASATPSGPVCEGTNITLNSTTSGGGAPFNFAWTGPNGYTANTQSATINGITVAGSGTYTVTITDGCGGNSVSTVAVTVNPLPSVAVSPANAILCPGSAGIPLVASGATTYSWSPGTGLSATTGSNVTATPTVSTTYTVTGTSSGCTATATATIVVPPVFSATASVSPTPICSGTNSQLTSIATSTSGYALSNPAYSTQACQSNAGPSGDDVVQGNDAIGFTFNYYGVNYTQFGLSTNGNIQLGDGTGSANNPAYSNSWTDVPIPNTGLPNNMIALAWDDWFITAGQITFGTSGTSPNRKLVVCFNTTGRGSGSADTLIGQIVLEETTNNIYLNITKKGIQPANTATEGIEDQTGSAASIGVAGRQSTAWSVNSASGDSRQFSPITGTYTYAWAPPTFLSATNINNPQVIAATATTTYTVTVSDVAGCSHTATATLTVNPLPTISATATNPTICDGSSTTLNGSGGTTYTWNPGALTGTSVTVSPTSTTTYTVSGTDANGCTNTALVTVTVNPAPTVVANSTATAVCTGSAVTLTGSGTATSYTWDNSVTDGVSFVPTATTTYMVTGAGANGCTATDMITVTVNPLPTVVANSTATAVCMGSAVTLTGSGATSYTWDNSVTDGVSFVPSATATYMVTGTDANGCSNTDNITVTVNPLPTVVANSTATTVCAGSAVTLTGSGTATSYAWDNSVTDGVSFVPAATTTYMVTGTDGNGCSATDMITVTVNPLPVVVANSTATTICSGSAVTLTGSGTATSYTWDNSVTDGVSFVPSATTTYMVTGTDANSCSATDMITVTVNPAPTVTLGPDVSQCGGTVTLDAGNAGDTYMWSDLSTSETNTVSVSGTYYVNVTDAGNGCVGSDTVVVSINSNPTVSLGADITQCGGTVTLDAGNAGSTYLWSDATTTQTDIVSTSGNYYVDVTDANGCMGSDSIMVTINTLPTVTGSASSTSVCVDDAAVTLTGTPNGGTWSGPGVTGSTFTPLTAGVGTQTTIYSFTDVNGCTNTASVVITVSACVGVVETSLANGVNIYPNPNNGMFTVSVNANVGDLVLEMTDAEGRVVYSSIENDVKAGFTKQISVENLANGIYLLRMTSNNEQKTEKISVQK